MKKMFHIGKRHFATKKGGGITDIIIWTAVLVFAFFPVASVVFEKYILIVKAQEIKDALDVTNIAAYNALSAESLSSFTVSFDNDSAINIYKGILAKNLRLNADLTPKSDSIAEGCVTVDEIVLYTSGLPVYCSKGKLLTRPSIHSCITVPVKPSLFRALILDMMGKQFVELHVHMDTELPVNK